MSSTLFQTLQKIAPPLEDSPPPFPVKLRLGFILFISYHHTEIIFFIYCLFFSSEQELRESYITLTLRLRSLNHSLLSQCVLLYLNVPTILLDCRGE